MKLELKIYLVIITSVLLSLLNASDGFAGMQKFEKANQLYKEGKYTEAIDVYKEILASGLESSDLYYNMGNAYYKSEQFIYAILYYEKAHKRNPSDEDIIENLKLANKYFVVDDIKELPEFFLTKWYQVVSQSLSCDTWAYVSSFTFVFFLALFLVYLFSHKRFVKKISFLLGIILLLISVLTFQISLNQKQRQVFHKQAIVFTPTVIVKSSPDDNGKELFNLHEGTKVTIIDSLDFGYEIKIANGNVGWILKTDVKPI